MLLTLSIFPQLQAQSARLKAQLAELDRSLVLRYGDSPKERLRQRFANAGGVAARKEAVIKQQLKDLWHSIRNR